MDNLVEFIKSEPLYLLVAFTIIAVALLIIKKALKWAIAGIVLVGFITIGTTYTGDLVSLQDEVLKPLQGQSHAVVKRFMDEGGSATYKGTGGGNFVISAKDVRVRGNNNGESLTFTYQGKEIVVPYSEPLKEYVANVAKK